MYGGDGVRAVADGGFGRKLGDHQGTPVLMRSEHDEQEFCVVLYWNDRERDEGVLIATIDDAHGQPVHVDLYRDGRKTDTEVLDDVESVYEAEQYVKDRWRELAKHHFDG